MDQERNQKITLQMDGIAFDLREKTDLSWIRPYGKVFYVYDRLTSGNLCFGVEGKYGKLFIKFAGARTVNYAGRPEDAIFTLQKAMPLYSIRHPSLTRLLAHGPAGDGYAAIYAWQDAPVLWPSPPDPAVLERVRRLQLSRSLKMLDGVFDLHGALAMEGYIAVDFSDENLLVHFDRDEMTVCDIDLYRKKPAVNDRGRMHGSSRFLAPEEYTLGASLDESTTVYAMGMLAFEIFGDQQERTRKNWTGPRALYDVAEKATKEKRAERYPSMRAFLNAWRSAVGDSWLR